MANNTIFICSFYHEKKKKKNHTLCHSIFSLLILFLLLPIFSYFYFHQLPCFRTSASNNGIALRACACAGAKLCLRNIGARWPLSVCRTRATCCTRTARCALMACQYAYCALYAYWALYAPSARARPVKHQLLSQPNNHQFYWMRKLLLYHTWWWRTMIQT